MTRSLAAATAIFFCVGACGSDDEDPAPFTLWDETSLGAWGLYLRLSRRTDPATARSLALSWRGDHLGVYVGDGSPPETVVVWRIELSDETSAERIRSHEMGAGGVRREVNRLVIVRTTGTSLPDWALIP